MILRDEYPRPSYVRANWQTLNGEWDFAFDDHNRGIVEEWQRCGIPNGQTINVPFAYQSTLSGINTQEEHSIVWYQREFSVPSSWRDQRVLLNFGAVDYRCTVWVNGKIAGHNSGGYVSFTFDITDLLSSNTNVLTVRVVDRPVTSQPRGKQRAKRENYGCWYTPVTGIWQSVWIEAAGHNYIDHVKLTPNIDDDMVQVEYWLNEYGPHLRLECVVLLEGEEVTTVTLPIAEQHTYYSDIVSRKNGTFAVSIPNPQLWSPESPTLYDMVFRLYRHNSLVDQVETYVGMRKIHAENGKIYLNNKPYYLRMILDQGFWPDGIYTAESIADIKYDVEMTKEFGFNGARKHQKFEDPYYYYYCDKLGLLTWCEMAAAYYYDEEVSENMTQEWQRLVIRHYNHPSVMAWVPVNESWGVDQLTIGSQDKRLVHHMITLYHLTKSLDTTRLVIGNDGWQQAITDLVAIHDYTQDAAELRERYARFKEDRSGKGFSHGHPIILPGFEYRGQPIMITEFGGVKVDEQGVEGWGYGQAARDYDDMLHRIESLLQFILEEEEICGYCYTQLTDVEQEVNGLLTYDRQPKVESHRFKALFGMNPKHFA